MKIIKSFKYALKGIVYAVRNERNMRVHSVVSLCVFVFSLFFNLNKEKYMIIFLTIGFVMAMEVINSSLESVVDFCARDYNSSAKISKDMAAGAVLISAIIAVIEGIYIFGDINGYIRMWKFFISYPWVIFPVLLFVILGYLYVVLGPTELKNKLKMKIKKLNLCRNRRDNFGK